MSNVELIADNPSSPKDTISSPGVSATQQHSQFPLTENAPAVSGPNCFCGAVAAEATGIDGVPRVRWTRRQLLDLALHAAPTDLEVVELFDLGRSDALRWILHERYEAKGDCTLDVMSMQKITDIYQATRNRGEISKEDTAMSKEQGREAAARAGASDA